MLKNKKVYVGDYSREIQEKAFKLGWAWSMKKKKPMYMSRPFLYFNKDKSIGCGKDAVCFNNHEYEEVTPEWIFALPEPPNPAEKSGFREPKKDIFLTKEEAEAYQILPFLLHWRDHYNGQWRPDWERRSEKKYIIHKVRYRLGAGSSYYNSYLFAFETAEKRDQFLRDFKEELEVIKPLL